MGGNRREALIINNMDFKQEGYMARDYSKKDAEQLAEQLKSLKFDVHPVEDLKAEKMEKYATDCK